MHLFYQLVLFGGTLFQTQYFVQNSILGKTYDFSEIRIIIYFFLFCKFKNLMLFWMKISKIIFQFWRKNSNMPERKILSKLNFQTKIRFLDQCVPRQEEAELLSILNRKFWWTARASKWSTFSLHSTITMWYVVSIVKEIDSPRALHIV